MIEMIGWIGFVFILMGYYLNAKQNIKCFYIWGLGNILFMDIIVGGIVMTKQEILDRIQNVLYQGVDTESQDLDLLRHDLELEIIKERND